ncbi:MAG: 50S ribosomal protein L25 [Ignavibacteria bacterium]
MAVLDLNALKRDVSSRSALSANRKKGNVPGIFYYKGSPSIPIFVKDIALHPFIYTSEVRTIELTIEGESKPYNCVLRDVQFDPISDKPIHFDLLGVSEHEKIKIEIPVTLVGSPAGVKEGGIIQQTLHKIEVECFPRDIPANIEVNIEHLNIGDSVHISDLTYDKFEILENPDTTIVAVVPPAIEEVAAPVVEGEAVPAEGEPAEPEVIAKGKKEEKEEGEEEEKEKGREEGKGKEKGKEKEKK